MDNSEQLLKAQQDVLTEMGRNLYNLQSIERLLKKIVAFSSVETRKQDNGEFATKSMNTNRMMLGKLAEAFISDIVVIANDPQSESFNQIELKSTELRMKFNFNLELIDHQEHHYLKSTIEKLVYDRNALVHQFHELHSVMSIESCQHALAYLKDKNIFIKEQYEYFKNIVNELDGLIKIHIDVISSDEFIETITNDLADSNPNHLN